MTLNEPRANLRPLFQRAVEKAYLRRGKGGKVGKRNPDGTITIDVEERPGFIYVEPDDGGPVVECMSGGITPSNLLPVRIVETHDGYHEAVTNGIRTNVHLGTAAGFMGMTARHTHEKGGGLDDYVSPNRFRPGLVHATTPASMSVAIEAFWYRYSGADHRVATTTFDLTSAQPGTAGMWAWIKVGYDPVAQDFVAVTGDEYSVVTPLDQSEEMLEDIDLTGYIPLGAVLVRADDTTIPEVDRFGKARFAIEDIRIFLGGGDVLGVTAHGALTGLTGSDDHTQYIIASPTTTTRNLITVPTASAKGLVLKTSDDNITNNLLEILTSASVITASIDALGELTLLSATTTAHPLYVLANAAQSTARTAPFVRITNSSGTLPGFFSITGDGRIMMARTGDSAAQTLPVQNTSVNIMNLTAEASAIHRAIWAAVDVNAVTTAPTRVDGLDAFILYTGSVTTPLAIAGVYSVRPSLTATGTITTSVGIDVSIQYFNTASTNIGTASLVLAYFNNIRGTITNAYHFRTLAATLGGSGAITNQYGIYLEDIANGTTLNFAIVTNAGNIVFNEGGNANSDVRIEGDTDANLFFTDASADFIGIGTNAPATKLDVRGIIRGNDHIQINADSKSLVLGAGQDATILYDGTNMVINPKVVGTGFLSILGDISLLNQNVILGAGAGTQFGTASNQKLAWWGATPIIQPAGAAQAALTNSSGGTGDGTISAVSGTGDDGTINDNFTELYTLTNAMRTALVNSGAMKGAA